MGNEIYCTLKTYSESVGNDRQKRAGLSVETDKSRYTITRSKNGGVFLDLLVSKLTNKHFYKKRIGVIKLWKMLKKEKWT